MARAAGRLAPWGVGAAAGVAALGPVLGPGFVLRYDMVFVPDPPLSVVTLGAGGGFPRAVPSDAVVGALARVLPTDAVQAGLLLAVFVLGAAGAARLVPGTALLPRLAAALFYVWNPFVAERLLLGQWAVLLGYAGLPWVLAATVRLAGARDLPRLVTALAPAAVGGFSSAVLSALVALPTALLRPRRRPAPGGPGAGADPAEDGVAVDRSDGPAGRPGRGPTDRAGRWGRGSADRAGGRAGRWGRRPGDRTGGPAAARAGRGLGRVGAAGLVVAALVVVGLPWLVPALGSGARTDPAAVDLFAARADTPFGVAGSLLALGGIWNAQAVPDGLGHPLAAACRLVLSLAALAGWVGLVRRGGVRYAAGLSAAAVVGFGIALLGAAEPGRDLLRALIAAWPGFGPLRDGQLYVAPLALLQAVGAGGAVAWLLAAGRAAPAGLGGDGAGAAGPTGAGRSGVDGADVVGGSGVVRGSGGADADGAGVAAGGDGVGRSAGPGADGSAVSAGAGAGGSGRSGGAGGLWGVGVVVALAPVVLLPGLLWGAGGRLVSVEYPEEWTAVAAEVAADPRPGAVAVLPWSAYRGLDWAGAGPPVVALDPAVKLFDRRVVWNDDLRVADAGGVRTITGEDPLAREVARLNAAGLDPADHLTRLGALGVRYVLVEREALRGPDAATDPLTAHLLSENRFSFDPDVAAVRAFGPRLALVEISDDHVEAGHDRLTGLEVTGWLVTVGALVWSFTASGSSLVSMRPARSAGTAPRKERSS